MKINIWYVCLYFLSSSSIYLAYCAEVLRKNLVQFGPILREELFSSNPLNFFFLNVKIHMLIHGIIDKVYYTRPISTKWSPNHYRSTMFHVFGKQLLIWSSPYIRSAIWTKQVEFACLSEYHVLPKWKILWFTFLMYRENQIRLKICFLLNWIIVVLIFRNF